MRFFYFIFLASIFLNSCSSDDMTKDDMSLKPSYTGNFVSAAHPTMGMVSVDETKTVLKIKNFKSDNGPLLELYLATSTSAATFISLGDLKGLDGDYEYTLPNSVDFDTYKYVMVWCVDFSVNFGHAELSKN